MNLLQKCHNSIWKCMLLCWQLNGCIYSIVLYFSSECHNSRQNVVVLFRKYFVDIRSEAWLILFGEYINRKIVCSAVQACFCSLRWEHIPFLTKCAQDKNPVTVVKIDPAQRRAAIQRQGSILPWIVILSVYGTDTIATDLSLSALISWFMKSWVFKQF